MQAAVCDGDTIGHPCCAVHSCKNPLVNHQHKFCTEHTYLSLQCAVTDCPTPHEHGYRTCAKPNHRALETSYFKHGKALFQLHALLKKAGISTLVDSAPKEPSSVHNDDEVVIEITDCRRTLPCPPYSYGSPMESGGLHWTPKWHWHRPGFLLPWESIP
jgi:hypothetical protein